MRKKLLIVLGVVVLIPVLGIAALFAIREPPDGPRVAAAPDVQGIEAGGAYAWIVRTAHGAALVDAGLDASGAAILAALTDAGVSAGQVSAVLVTHGHPDHYAAAARFPQATVYVSAADISMLHGDKTHYATFGKMMGSVLALPPAPEQVEPLQGGEHLDIDGATFTVVATPGHSPGSVMYLYKNILFTGDSLMRKKDGVAIVPSLFSEDAGLNRSSLGTLKPLAFEIIADGHAGVAHDAKQKLARFLAGS